MARKIYFVFSVCRSFSPLFKITRLSLQVCFFSPFVFFLLYPHPSPLIPICEAEAALEEGNSKITSHLLSSIAFVFSFVPSVQPTYLHISRIAGCYFVVKLSTMAAENTHTPAALESDIDSCVELYLNQIELLE